MQSIKQFINRPLLVAVVFGQFLAGFIFSWRAVSSISCGILILPRLFSGKQAFKIVFSRPLLFFLLANTLFFLLAVLSGSLHADQAAAIRDIQLKSGLILIPLAVVLNVEIVKIFFTRLMRVYCFLLFIASVFCLVSAFILFSRTSDSSVFFFHELVSPLRQHPVYFSIYLFIAIVFLSAEREPGILKSNALLWTVILFFTGMLVLLSSKLVLFFLIGHFLYQGIRAGMTTAAGRKGIAGLLILFALLIVLVMVTQNPLGKRVREILNTDWQLVQQEKFHPGVYFNDIQLRLLQWKFVVRILSEKQSWWTGTGAGQAQELLDQEYIDANMYLGDPATGDRGYREFNAHSQLFESLLRYGLPGVLLFGLVILSMLIILFYVKSTPFRIILLLLVAYSLVESVYETQYGILLFTFFPVFLYFQTANRLIKNND